MTISFQDGEGRPAVANMARLTKKFGEPWSLRVQHVTRITPSVLRVNFAVDRPGLRFHPGQNFVLLLPDDDEHHYSRHYTIADYSPEQGLAIDFVLHGKGPGTRWAEQAQPGWTIAAYGPRGRVVPASAAWQIFACDLTGVPAVAAIFRALPAETQGVAIMDVTDARDIRPLPHPPGITVHWRTLAPGQGDPVALLPTARPEGACLATLVGETGSVRAQRAHLLQAGFAPNEIIGEGYWRHGRFGGHDNLDAAPEN